VTASVQPLPREFYARDTIAVARDLLGRVLVRQIQGERLSGIIVETEAYGGAGDRGSHAWRGPTPRNRAMFGPPGHAYVYRIYGVHCCLNLVAESDGAPGAVLIRSLRPLEGLSEMRRRRGRPDDELTDGPGKLCQALGIDLAVNGLDLCQGEELWVEAGSPLPEPQVARTARVGLAADEEARERPWRFMVRGDPYVSRPRPTSWRLGLP